MIRMPKLSYVPTTATKNNEDIKHEDREAETKKIQKLEVSSEKERNEMDFSKICELDDNPPDLEPVE